MMQQIPNHSDTKALDLHNCPPVRLLVATRLFSFFYTRMKINWLHRVLNIIDFLTESLSCCYS